MWSRKAPDSRLRKSNATSRWSPWNSDGGRIPNVQAIRTISLFGLCNWRRGPSLTSTAAQAERWVTNRLSQLGAAERRAGGFSPPPVGEIFRYRVVGPANYSVTDLKTLQDWVLQRHLLGPRRN